MKENITLDLKVDEGKEKLSEALGITNERREQLMQIFYTAVISSTEKSSLLKDMVRICKSLEEVAYVCYQAGGILARNAIETKELENQSDDK